MVYAGWWLQMQFVLTHLVMHKGTKKPLNMNSSHPNIIILQIHQYRRPWLEGPSTATYNIIANEQCFQVSTISFWIFLKPIHCWDVTLNARHSIYIPSQIRYVGRCELNSFFFFTMNNQSTASGLCHLSVYR